MTHRPPDDRPADTPSVDAQSTDLQLAGSRSADTPATDVRSVHRLLADGGFDDAFFRTLVERVGVGVAVYDDTGTVRYATDAVAAVLGLDRSAVVGTTLWEIDPDVDRDRFEDYWAAFDVGETREDEVPLGGRDGESAPLETVTTAIDVGGTVYHVATITDATDCVDAWAEMERQDERLSEVASVISHDLRNPLNVAMGRAELAAMDCDSEHLEYVERSLRKMEALITDVLTVARKGSRITDPEPVGLADAVNTAWYEISDSEHATLEMDGPLGTVRSENNRLAELFVSLFENAVVHGGPDVSITVGRFEEGFYVADDGPGVDPDDRETVFEDGYSSTNTGTGFGLTIVEHVAAAHDWEVGMTESQSGGVRVEVRGVDFLD